MPTRAARAYRKLTHNAPPPTDMLEACYRLYLWHGVSLEAAQRYLERLMASHLPLEEAYYRAVLDKKWTKDMEDGL
jgi:hypothetical protein